MFKLTRSLFSHPVRETPPSSFHVIDISSFLSDRDGEFKTLLGPSINLRYSLGSNVPHIEADPLELKELLEIFLSNARKAMVQGGQLLLQTREVSVTDIGSPFPSGTAVAYVMLAISDSGNGIHPETQARIQQLLSGRWRPRGDFFTGLTRAKEILDKHQAKLLFYSQLNRGTSFKIYLPLKRPGTTQATAAPGSKGSETLLFVEDDAMIRQIYTKYLRQRGYSVLEAEHGRDAFKVYENFGGKIDLMITDVVMPELNGRQLVDLMSLNYPHLKVLYISGFTKDAIVQRGILKPDMPFLEKPFGREELALRVRQILDLELS